MRSYPIHLVGLENQRCLVIGGGEVAARKAAGLVAAGAHPLLISPSLHPQLNDMLVVGQIEHLTRPYQPGDLQDAFLVIAATTDPHINRQIGETCRKMGVLVNVVDAPKECNFIAPAVVRQGDFVVSISTGGATPALAARIRAQLETQFGPHYGAMVALCAAIRPAMRAAFPDPEERKAHWYELVDSPVLSLLAAGRDSEARALIEAILETHLDEIPHLEALMDSQ